MPTGCHRYPRSLPDELLTEIVDQILMPLSSQCACQSAPVNQIRRAPQRIARRRRKMRLAVV
jgi:hypothetical protein